MERAKTDGFKTMTWIRGIQTSDGSFGYLAGALSRGGEAGFVIELEEIDNAVTSRLDLAWSSGRCINGNHVREHLVPAIVRLEGEEPKSLAKSSTAS